MTYQQRIIKLSEQYDLDTLGDQQDIQLEQSFNQGRIKLKKAINRAEAKKGFSNTKVATKLDESRKAIEQTVKRTGLIDRRLRSVDVATTDEVDAMLPPGTDDSAEPDDGSD